MIKHRDIFKRGSKTYFYSSVFFPRQEKEDIFTLYAFVRTADDFVDATPQNQEGFENFYSEYLRAHETEDSKIEIIGDFLKLQTRKKFDPLWVIAFLDAMKADLTKSTYGNIGETIQYMYGSAEVVGLMMARIMNLPDESLHAAQMLGRSMQYINFIRDIQEDNELGRTYLPGDQIEEAGLTGLTETEAKQKPEAFQKFIREQIEQYRVWVAEAEKGFHFIPKRLRVPIQTASDMYRWTARVIEKDPMVVFENKVKPKRSQIIYKAFTNTLQ